VEISLLAKLLNLYEETDRIKSTPGRAESQQLFIVNASVNERVSTRGRKDAPESKSTLPNGGVSAFFSI
jgi:hypothetical protein